MLLKFLVLLIKAVWENSPHCGNTMWMAIAILGSGIKNDLSKGYMNVYYVIFHI